MRHRAKILHWQAVTKQLATDRSYKFSIGTAAISSAEVNPNIRE